jgi:predicted NBD/HSP70 family sugar kinase
MPVFVDNDATAAAIGERWTGVAADVSDFVYLYLGSGVGAGIFANYQVCRGASGNSGEVGHVSVEPDGPPCYCGNRGCLEVYATPQGILREARGAVLRTSHLPGEVGPPLPGRVEDVVASDEPAFRAVVENVGDRLGRAVSRMVGVLDPELVVLGGPTVELVGPRLEDAVVHALRAASLPVRPPARVELSSIGADAGPVGAAALVLHDAYAPSMQRLSLS